jgi:hypothetical protein
MDIPLFRQTFPEFSDNAVYTDVLITFWSDLAECEINQDRFGCAYTAAVNLYTAHNISIAAQNINQASFGGSPGTTGGAIQSKSVGSASVSYDDANSIVKDGGFWNQTVYGRNYMTLVNKYGQGCYQL